MVWSMKWYIWLLSTLNTKRGKRLFSFYVLYELINGYMCTHMDVSLCFHYAQVPRSKHCQHAHCSWSLRRSYWNISTSKVSGYQYEISKASVMFQGRRLFLHHHCRPSARSKTWACQVVACTFAMPRLEIIFCLFELSDREQHIHKWSGCLTSSIHSSNLS